jgi:hypothetical protein
MRMDTRASIARFTTSAVTFIFPTCVVWCRNSCGRALLVSGTNRSIYTQRGCLCCCPVPSAVWADIGLDFVEALPRVNGKTVILSVVDRFSKYCHFIPLAHPYTVGSVVQAFFADIVHLHGVPQSIVSDRDPVFTSTFWCELMRLMGTKLHMTSAFHPQSDS